MGMRIGRLITTVLVLTVMIGSANLATGNAAPVTRECTAVETVALPTQVPQTFGCSIHLSASACGVAQNGVLVFKPCSATAVVEVNGIGIVGGDVRLSGGFTPFFFTNRCGQAVATCSATVNHQFAAFDEDLHIFPEEITATCTWQGLVAVNVQLRCVLIATPVV